MALALKVKQPTVSEWLRGDRRVPAERCPEIERGTRERNGEDPDRPVVTCEELRPDVAWEVLRLQVAPADQAATDLEIADRRRSERRAIDDQSAGQGA